SRLRQIAVHTSAPLSDIVAGINKPSQNLYADMVLKTLGAELPAEDEDLEPGSSGMGIEVAMTTFSRAGIDTSRIQLVDGSGLSSMNLVTPDMTTSLLTYMWSHPSLDVREAFYRSLPIAGTEGTLRNRLTSGPARENLRAKTGSLSNVSTLSGYLRAEDGTPLAFSLMSNHYTTRTADVRTAQDAVVNLLARYRP
ncbi:MAG: D-alanyl-D-alanine carboxypeptidase/D-alanyl-D-alanine-endopeptidase, partial [Rhodothermales bacterium]